MVWLRTLLQTLFQSSSAVQSYALLLLGTSFMAAGAMYITAEIVLDQVSLNALQQAPLVADVAALGVAPYTPDAADQRFRGLRAEVAEEARRDTTARASAAQTGGFGFSSDTLSVLLDPEKRLPSTAPAVQSLPAAAVVAPAATVTPPPLGPEGSGPVLAPPTVVATASATAVVVATPPRATATVAPSPTTLPTPVIVAPAPTVVVALPPTPIPTTAPPTAVAATPTPPPSGDGEGGGSSGGSSGGSGGGSSGGSSGGSGGGSSGGSSGGSGGGSSGGSSGGAPGPSAPPAAPGPVPPPPPPPPPPVPVSTAGPIAIPPEEAPPTGPAPEVGIDLRAVAGEIGSDNGTGTKTGETVMDLIAFKLRSPGTSFSAPLRIANYGLRPFTYRLTTSAVPVGSTDNRLFTDELCPLPGDPTRKCGYSLQLKITRGSGEASQVLYQGPIEITEEKAKEMQITVKPGTADLIKIEVSMPLVMPSSFTGLASDVKFIWTATECTITPSSGVPLCP